MQDLSLKDKLCKATDRIVNKELDQSKTIKERAKIVIKTHNVARRVIKNLMARPNEKKCRYLKRKKPLLMETIFRYRHAIRLFITIGFEETAIGLEMKNLPSRDHLESCLT